MNRRVERLWSLTGHGLRYGGMKGVIERSPTAKGFAGLVLGGIVTSTLLTLVVIPAIYYLWRRRQVAA